MASQPWLCAADAQQLSAAFAEGRARPTELLRACLARLEQCDAQLGVCNHRLDPAPLLEAAAAAAERWRQGAPLSPLDGIPFGVKANIAVRGQPWHGGIQAFRARRAKRDAVSVARLRAAGMIPVAIFNMHEGALGETSANPAFQTTRNPHSPAHIPGGSSGGSAAAVAAGMAPVALGTDSLGSVRLPSALCGVVGFKPAHGEIPMDGVMPLSPRLDAVGVHARSVADVAMVMALLAPAADWAIPQTPPHPQGALRRLHWRLGAQTQLDQPISLAFARLLRQQAVADVLDWSDVDLSALRRAGLLVCEREGAHHYAAALRQSAEGFSETLRRLLAWGAAQPNAKVRQAESRLAEAKRRLRTELAGGLLFSPTTAHLAPRCGAVAPTTLADLTAPAAIAGIASISVPLGKSPSGLPMGLQISGLDGAAVLSAAQRCFPDVAEIAGA